VPSRESHTASGWPPREIDRSTASGTAGGAPADLNLTEAGVVDDLDVVGDRAAEVTDRPRGDRVLEVDLAHQRLRAGGGP
jgi:hypothetical protein